jgi:hypothetical protein
MKNYVLGMLTITTIILTIVLIIILNTKIYFDNCWQDGTCEVRTIKIIDLIIDDYLKK